MFIKPGCWAWARFEREGSHVVHLRIWHANERGVCPDPVHILALLLVHVHAAMGGHPDKPGDLVALDQQSILHNIMGGTMQVLTVWPNTPDEVKASGALEHAWPEIVKDSIIKCGVMGTVTESKTERGGDVIEIHYGPGVALANAIVPARFVPDAAKQRPTVKDVPPATATPGTGRIVELEATLRPRSSLRA